jgi:Ribonuclease G/E
MISCLVDKKNETGHRSRRIRGRIDKNKLNINPRPLLSEYAGEGMACRTKGNKEWLVC